MSKKMRCPSYKDKLFLFFFLVTRVNHLSSFVTNGAADKGVEGGFIVGARDEDLVLADDGSEICLLVVHNGNSSDNVLKVSD